MVEASSLTTISTLFLKDLSSGTLSIALPRSCVTPRAQITVFSLSSCDMAGRSLELHKDLTNACYRNGQVLALVGMRSQSPAHTLLPKLMEHLLDSRPSSF